MKYYSRLNMYKASNVSFNPESLKSYSYDWWLFTRMHNGSLVFNNANYSISTCGHQSKVRNLLGELGHDIDLVFRFTNESLKDIELAAQDEINLAEDRIKELNELINKKGTRKTTNEKRRMEIEDLQLHIAEVEQLIRGSYDND